MLFSKPHLWEGKAYKLYKEHGTCLRGLLSEKIIEEDVTTVLLTDRAMKL